tara:strand:- start:2969 stop:3523 length:555 start_codon:yes stop_codon:yes gene_type:complete
MRRDYETGEADNVKIFTGIEVEHTPAFGQKTLFVVGIHNPIDLAQKAREEDCTHIYLGANQSFNPDMKNSDHIEDWHDMISVLLEEGWLVTLDYDVMYHQLVIDNLHESTLPMSSIFRNFIPQISVKIPHIEELNYNACIKIDDVDYNHSNPGVWVHQVNELMQRSKFTDWKQYTKDKPIKEVD